ncbi:uncharacterized protein LOC105686174 isoform X1 [Athalia rosae]|uniref:uncharacterized protein LOC105686174 isoform X1 n=1 Tax=Athalia rosae TaxID=37344 RepID=UPI002034A1ED|nr:uncharacterized protein LOC105686174 isoform X1 [Athalia rosae]XP_048507933.1 uncharacterized protein LOC105686174 isoform X1 [Athalia rosae]
MGYWNCGKREIKTWVKLLFASVCFNCVIFVNSDNVTKSSRNARTFVPFPNSKFVTFNTHGDSLGIDLDLSIPFLSIPLDQGYGAPQSLVNINAKALTIAGIFTAVSTVIVPLIFDKHHPASNYRSDDARHESWNYGDAVNQIFMGNSYLAPCTKKFICSMVSNACHSKKQKTGMDKIIDGISSLEWFDRMTEGTVIQEAVLAGRKSEGNCNVLYPQCFLSRKFFPSSSDPTADS